MYHEHRTRGIELLIPFGPNRAPYVLISECRIEAKLIERTKISCWAIDISEGQRSSDLFAPFLLFERCERFFRPSQNTSVLLIGKALLVDRFVIKIAIPIRIEDQELSSWSKHAMPFCISGSRITHEPSNISHNNRIEAIIRKRQVRSIFFMEQDLISYSSVSDVRSSSHEHLRAHIDRINRKT